MKAKRGIQLEDWGDDIAIPLKPTSGMWSFVSGIDVPPGGSPDMLNCVVRQSVLTKRPGYTMYPTGMSALAGSRIMGLYSTQDVNAVQYLFAATTTGLHVLTSLAGGWSAVTGAALTGSNEKRFSFETSQNSVVFSQGVDQVMRAVFGGTYAILNANCPAAHYMARWADRLFIARTVESAVNQPFRVRRPISGDHTNWTGLGSGFTDLVETHFHLRGIKKLNTQLAVYAEKAIFLGTKTGLAESPARYDLQISDVGIYLPYSLKGRNEIHYFAGDDDIYSFNGAQIQSIGWQVRDEMFPTLNVNKPHMMFAEILNDTQEYLLFMCTGSSETPDKVWVYNWARQIWYPWSVSGPVCSTIHKLDSGATIDSIGDPIDSVNYEIDSATAQAQFPAMITGHTDAKTYQWSRQYLSDDGATIPCRWTSQDFSPKDIGAQYDEQIVLKAVHVRYKKTGIAATLRFWFSSNGGDDWVGPFDATLLSGTSGFGIATVHRQITGSQIRFKFENNTADETFQIAELIPVFEKPGTKAAA